MPVVWNEIKAAPEKSGAVWRSDKTPVASVILRPNRSLPRVGFAWMLLIAWLMLMLPLLPLVGSPALWALLPFMLAILAALWVSIRRSYQDGEMFEELTLWPDLIKVYRHNPRSQAQKWQGNPFWTTLAIRAEGGPVEQYITLKGAGREIELGAFLSPDERIDLHLDLQRQLARAKTPQPAK
ncbi:MAG: putative membrane protein [Paracoccaceae bacterium]|jgi:uncharacterized membrane protein